MKRTFLLAFAMVVSTLAMAQREVGRFSVVPRVGVSLANLSGDAIYQQDYAGQAMENKARYKAGFVGGVDVDYQVLPQLSVSLGAFYSQQGCRYGNNKTTLEINGKEYKNLGFSNMKSQADYLNIPLMFNLYVTPNLAFKVGAQLGLNLSGKSKYTETPYTVKENGDVIYEKPEDVEIDMKCKSVAFSIPLGVSYEYENVVVDARYNIGLTQISNLEGVKSPKSQVIEFTVGYRFGL